MYLRRCMKYEKNDIIENAEVTGLTHDGRGVVRVDGLAVFVPGVFPGEVCSFRLAAVKKKYAQGELVRITKASGDRRKRVCPHPECGACVFTELSCEAQLLHKRQAVESTLKRIGKIVESEVRECLGMENPFHYRNKAVFHAGIYAGKPVLGFHLPGTHTPVPVPDCILLRDGIRAVYAVLLEAVRGGRLEPVNGSKGFLRRVLVRESGGLLVRFFVSEPGRIPEDVVKALTGAGVGAVQEAVAGKGANSPAVVHQLVEGAPLFEEYSGKRIFFSPEAFAQVNPLQAEKLYLKSLEAAGPLSGKSVLDLYCGAGFLGLLAGSAAGRVVGIDISRPAIRDARRNAESLGIGHARFDAGKTGEHLHRLLREENPDCVFVDPPRSGCEPETIQALVAAAPERIVYVSCDPGTFARDAAALIAGGYRMGVVQPVDMFPWTHHVELVAGFAKDSKA